MTDYVAPTVEEFRVVFPEFEDVTDPVVQAALDEAALSVDSTWGTSRLIAVRLLAAYFLAVAAETDIGGALNSVSIGSISVSFARNQSTELLEGNSYGQRYLRIRRPLFGGPLVIGC